MKKVLLSLASGAAACLLSTSAFADTSVIKQPGAHPSYIFEAEPHALVQLFDDFLPGVGFRGTFKIVDNGFVKTINNSIGVGIGADWNNDHFRLPLVMQWNFWLTQKWSVFGEPGVLLDFHDDKTKPHPTFYAGGRFAFTDKITLTMRVGYPLATVGVSFLL
jgi:hypothetical protein